jgi:hypothetical protein
MMALKESRQKGRLGTGFFPGIIQKIVSTQAGVSKVIAPESQDIGGAWHKKSLA